MLGSVSDAEDVVQEALLRLHNAMESGEQIDSPPAYLSTITTRLSIDELRSARVKRETYVGEWLPEPIVEGDAAPTADPAAHAELSDSLSVAFLVVLESLSPEQRAVFLLRDVFDYPYDEIAELVDKSEPAVRQIAVRARRHVEERKPRYHASREEQDELTRRFLAAAEDGDVAELEAMLAADVEVHGDGGGKVPAIARPLHGRKRVAKTLSAWSKAAERFGVARFRPARINGQPGAIAETEDGTPVVAMELGISDGQIQSIHSVVNPDKLKHLG
jgi:RNA polymerase sigma-70 factor (ECF subfamily)